MTGDQVPVFRPGVLVEYLPTGEWWTVGEVLAATQCKPQRFILGRSEAEEGSVVRGSVRDACAGRLALKVVLPGGLARRVLQAAGDQLPECVDVHGRTLWHLYPPGYDHHPPGLVVDRQNRAVTRTDAAAKWSALVTGDGHLARVFGG